MGGLRAPLESTIRPLVLTLALLLAACSPDAPSAASGEPSPETAAAAPPSPAPATSPTPAVTVQKLDVKGAQSPSAKKKDGPKRWLGITVANMKEAIDGAPDDRRAMITRSLVGGPSAASGLLRGDVIVKANGSEVHRYQDYIAEARKTEIGQSIEITALRAGKPVHATLTMVGKPGNHNAWRKTKFPGVPFFAYDMPNLKPEGTRTRSAEAEGKPKLLYFWATWCGPCRRTGPWVEELAVQAGDRIQVAAVSSEELDKLKPYAKRSQANYVIAHDDTGYTKWDYEVNKLPTIVLIDADGVIVAWDIGTSGVRSVLKKARKLLDLPAPPPKAKAG